MSIYVAALDDMLMQRIASSVLEFFNNLRGLGTELEQGCRTVSHRPARLHSLADLVPWSHKEI